MVLNVNLGRTGKLDIDRIRDVSNAQSDKPRGGLWGCRPDAQYSWESWCIREMPEWLSKEQAQVNIKDSARILVLDSKEKVEAFYRYDRTGGYGRPDFDYQRIARDYDVVDFRVSECYSARLMTIDMDSTVILNKDVIESIKNPESVTKFNEKELAFFNAVAYNGGASFLEERVPIHGDFFDEFWKRDESVMTGLVCYYSFDSYEERKGALDILSRINGNERYASSYTIIENYDRVKGYIEQHGGELDEKKFNRILLEIGMDKNADEVMGAMRDAMFSDHKGGLRNSTNNFYLKFYDEYIYGCRPWRLTDLKLRHHLFKTFKLTPVMKDAVSKECLRAVLRDPSYNTWKEMDKRIPAIVSCLSG